MSIVVADETVLRAMRWGSGLHDEGALLGLIAELPEQIVKELVFLHGQEKSKPKQDKHDEIIVVELSPIGDTQDRYAGFHEKYSRQSLPHVLR